MPEEITGEQPSAASGFLGMFNAFVDPAGLAKAARAKLFWLWPLITVSVIYIVIGYLMLPYTLQLVDIKMSERAAQQGAPAERIESMKNVAHMISQITPILTPIGVVLIIAFMAWLVTLVGSMVDLRAKFRDVFSLMAACSLIRSLQYIATYVVVRTKGDEITSPEQLLPPFGLDIFVSGAHGALLALLNFFSIFQIWYILILGLALAAFTNSTKGKAFFAITPAWVIPLIGALIGSLFSGSTS